MGEVVSIETAMDPQTYEIIQPVEIFLYPDRLKIRSLKSGALLPPPVNEVERLKILIKKGLRAQMRTGSYLTGQQYIAISTKAAAPYNSYFSNTTIYRSTGEIHRDAAAMQQHPLHSFSCS